MKPKKRKKSLVGYVGDEWYGEFRLLKSVMVHHPCLNLTRIKAEPQDIKVRITIEEL